MPFEELRAVELERRRRRRHGEAPERGVAGEKGVRLLADRAPEARGIAELRAPQARRCRLHRGGSAREPHVERAVVPGTRRKRQRLARPAVHGVERRCLVHVEAQCALCRRPRQHFDGDLGNDTQRPQ